MITKFHLIAKIVFNVLGIYSFIICLNFFDLSLFIQRIFENSGSFSLIVKAGLVIVFKIILLLVLFNIFFLHNNWILKMTGPTGQDEKPLSDISILAGLRISFFLCGLLIIVHNLDFICQSLIFIIYVPKILVDMFVYKYVHEMFSMPFNSYLVIFGQFCQSILGLYLVIGAPRFVNWQINKLNNL